MESTETHSLPVPLFGVLVSLGFSHHEEPHHFDIGTLFWSQVRLFGFYSRILSVLSLRREERLFLDSDIEGFIIRFRIVLNDVAYVVRQLLPKNRKGLKGPKGGTHPRNREMSMFDLASFIQNASGEFPELANAFSANTGWMQKLRDQRDNVVHYKSKAIVFETEPLSFALINAAGAEKYEPTENGGSNAVTIPIFEFVNNQTLALHKFLHCDLALAIEQYVRRVNLKYQQVDRNPRMSCPGIDLFRRLNGIDA